MRRSIRKRRTGGGVAGAVSSVSSAIIVVLEDRYFVVSDHATRNLTPSAFQQAGLPQEARAGGRRCRKHRVLG